MPIITEKMTLLLYHVNSFLFWGGGIFIIDKLWFWAVIHSSSFFQELTPKYCHLAHLQSILDENHKSIGYISKIGRRVYFCHFYSFQFAIAK